MSFEIRTTEDGSISVRDPATGELYHNRAGAYAEAFVNYIEPALKSGYRGLPHSVEMPEQARTLEVLDVCFGLGYNTFVLLAELGREPLREFSSVNITCFDRDEKILELLPKVLEFPPFEKLRTSIGELNQLTRFGETVIALGNGCTARINIVQGDIRELIPDLAASASANLDFVFHDAFSPKHVPELWTIDLFHCYRSLLDARKGMLLTYSSASAVRGALMDAGFHVWRSTALGGKSGGTVATVNSDLQDNAFIYKLTDDEKKKLRSASGVPFRDPTFRADRNTIRTQRLAEQFEYRTKR